MKFSIGPGGGQISLNQKFHKIKLLIFVRSTLFQKDSSKIQLFNLLPPPNKGVKDSLSNITNSYLFI